MESGRSRKCRLFCRAPRQGRGASRQHMAPTTTTIRGGRARRLLAKERRPDRSGGRTGVLDAGGRDRNSGGQDRDAEEARRRARVFLRGLQPLRLGQGGSSIHLRPGQPFLFGGGRHLARAALPDAAVRARKAGPRARAAASSTSRSTFAARRRPSANMSRSSSRQKTGVSCWSRSDLRTLS